MSVEKLTAVDAALEQLVADKNIAGCVVAVTRHGKLAYFKALGMADIEAGKPMTTDAIFRIQMIANGGELDGKRLLKEETVKLMTTNQLPESIPHIAIGSPRQGVGFGLGFSVRTRETELWDAAAPLGEFGWGGAASTRYWVSPKDDLVVVAMQQQMPFTFLLENTIKPRVYEAVEK